MISLGRNLAEGDGIAFVQHGGNGGGEARRDESSVSHFLRFLRVKRRRPEEFCDNVGDDLRRSRALLVTPRAWTSTIR